MAMLAQNLAVLLLVGICVAYVGRQIFQALHGRKSKLGSCCAKGCAANEVKANSQPKPAPVQFMPLENLGRRVHK
jgi:hypothetical protein